MWARPKYFSSSASNREFRIHRCSVMRTVLPGRTVRKLLLEPTASAVPVLLDANGIGVDAETGQLRPLAQAALDLGEAGERRQGDHVIPERTGVGRARQPADHGSEEGRPARRLKVQDRCADVTPGQR